MESCEISVIFIELLYFDLEKEKELLKEQDAGSYVQDESNHEKSP